MAGADQTPGAAGEINQAAEAEQGQEEAEEAVRQAQEEDSPGSEQEPAPDQMDYKDLYVRTVAEFENYKKRAGREMDEFKKFANERLITEILPAIDNLERALECVRSPEEAAECSQDLMQGVELTRKELLKVLERYGVTAVTALGEPFDPAYHQALMAEASDEHPEETVIREMQKGYLLKDRLIRPALVAVAKAK